MGFRLSEGPIIEYYEDLNLKQTKSSRPSEREYITEGIRWSQRNSPLMHFRIFGGWGIGMQVQQEANTGVWQDSGSMTGSLGKSRLQVEPEASSPAHWQSLPMCRSCKVNSSGAQVGDSKELFLPTQKVFNTVVVLYLRCGDLSQ